MGIRDTQKLAAKYTTGFDQPFQFAGAPTSGAGGTYAARAAVGSLLVDTTNARLYICTAASGGSVTWANVNTQT